MRQAACAPEPGCARGCWPAACAWPAGGGWHARGCSQGCWLAPGAWQGAGGAGGTLHSLRERAVRRLGAVPDAQVLRSVQEASSGGSTC